MIVTAISDKSKEALIHFSKTWKINNTYLDYNQMLQSENLDMISICSDENSHYQMVLDASKSGVKLIFCEKPIAKNSAQAKEMISSCKKNNVKKNMKSFVSLLGLFCMFYNYHKKHKK